MTMPRRRRRRTTRGRRHRPERWSTLSRTLICCVYILALSASRALLSLDRVVLESVDNEPDVHLLCLPLVLLRLPLPPLQARHGAQ